MMMKAISVLQPYAWLIIRPDITDPAERAAAYARGHIKDIENRDWPTKVRERVLIHAGKSYSRRLHDEYAVDMMAGYGIELPPFEKMDLGGIVGSVDIVDCVEDHPSRWKMDETWGFVLANATPLPFRPFRGMLGFFGVPA